MTVFVINLKTREDRRKHVLRESEEYGMTVHFVEAIDGSLIEQIDSGFLTTPALACWKSHLKTLQEVAKSSTDTCLVLEDDFEIIDFRKLQRILHKIEVSEWDIVQIGFLTHDFKEWISIKLMNFEASCFFFTALISKFVWAENLGLNKRLRVARAKTVPINFVPDDLRAGAHAYIISQKCAEDILARHGEQRVLTADGFFIATNWTRPYKTLRLRKSLIRQIDSASSIKGFK